DAGRARAARRGGAWGVGVGVRLGRGGSAIRPDRARPRRSSHCAPRTALSAPRAARGTDSYRTCSRRPLAPLARPDRVIEAIVMAAGEGRRLRPVTERWPKPTLPIDGHPVIATLLRELRSAGCERVTVVTGHLAEQVEGGFAGRIVAAGETPFAHASLWGLGPELVPYLEGLGGPPFELAEAYQRAIDDGLRVSAFEVGRTRDLTDALDLVQENFPYL